VQNRVQKFCEKATFAKNSSECLQQHFHLVQPSCKLQTTKLLTANWAKTA
jgi:hypothetical protein